MINIPTPNKFDSIVAAKQQEEADIILQQVVNNLENGTTFCLGTHTFNAHIRQIVEKELAKEGWKAQWGLMGLRVLPLDSKGSE